MSKPEPARYRTTNWQSYNDALKRRGSLLQQAADQPEGVHNPLAQGALQDFLQVPAQIAAHPADIALELAGMGVTTDLDRQSRREAGIALGAVRSRPSSPDQPAGRGPARRAGHPSAKTRA